MTEEEIDETLARLWEKTFQLGVVVKDMDAAISFYERFGIGPFVEGESGAARNRQVHGRPAPDVRVKGAKAKMGRVELELLQPVSGTSYQAEHLERVGEGAIHLCAYVDADDYDRAAEALAARGAQIVSYGEFGEASRFAYFGTTAVGNIALELSTNPRPDIFGDS